MLFCAGLQTCKASCYSFETGEKGPALNVLMAEIDPANAASYNSNAQAFFTLYLNQVIPYTPGGFAYPYHWGASRPTTQVRLVTCLAHIYRKAANGRAVLALPGDFPQTTES